MSNQLSQKCPNSIQNQVRNHPEEPVDLLLRVESVQADYQKTLEQAGFEIRHTMRLVPTYAVHGAGHALLTVLDHQWLISVESDGPVRAF